MCDNDKTVLSCSKLRTWLQSQKKNLDIKSLFSHAVVPVNKYLNFSGLSVTRDTTKFVLYNLEVHNVYKPEQVAMLMTKETVAGSSTVE